MKEGVENLDEILTVKEIDVLFSIDSRSLSNPL
jgi:2-keto-3-deoxy-L-rhamnonate aldolase RhmA